MNLVTTGGYLKINPQNLNVGHLRTNDSHIRRYERFMEKNKLDNALVVSGSGEVVDLYDEALRDRRLGFAGLLWLRSCNKLANGFHSIGRLLSKAGRFWL